MKFRAKIQDPPAMRKFYSLLTTMAKLSKFCIFRLTGDKLYFILTENSLNLKGNQERGGSPSVWCELDRLHLFSEFNMEGVTDQDPEIYLEVEPDRMAKTLNALKSTTSTRSLKMKLTRKHNSPCLSFELELTSGAGSNVTSGMSVNNVTTSADGFSRICTHDIPVTLIPRRLWPDFFEPELSPFDVSVYLPDIKQVKNITERYKNIGHQFNIQANREGHLKLVLSTDLMDVVTHFKDLEIPRFDATLNRIQSQSRMLQQSMDENNRAPAPSDKFFSVCADLRRFHLFFSACEQMAPKSLIANLCQDKMIHILLVEDDVCIQYYIPGVME